MQDKEIIKALECCSNLDSDNCPCCPLYGMKSPKCLGKLCTESINLINRQEAETESFIVALAKSTNKIVKLNARLKKVRALNKELKAELKSLRALKAYLDDLCGLDLEILGVDQQGDLVSYDDYYKGLLNEIGLGG